MIDRFRPHIQQVADLTCIPRMVGPKSGLNYLHLIEDPPSLFPDLASFWIWARPSCLRDTDPFTVLLSVLGFFLIHSDLVHNTLLGHRTSTGLMTVSFVLLRWQLCRFGQLSQKQILREDLSASGLLLSRFQEALVGSVEKRQTRKESS